MANDEVVTPQPTQSQRQAVQINDENASSIYANFCRVTGAPEELLVDFGLNPQPVGVPTQPINISQRVVMNYYTAKRMLHALQLTLQRHEALFGVLELDVNKRLRGPLMAPPVSQNQPNITPPQGE